MKASAPSMKWCPFCGGLGSYAVVERRWHNGSSSEWSVECIKCAAFTESQRTQEMALAAWNRRWVDQPGEDTGPGKVEITRAQLLCAVNEWMHEGPLHSFEKLAAKLGLGGEP